MHSPLTTRLALLVLIAWAGGARGDVIELANGGRIEGTIVETGQEGSDVYTITTAGGGRIEVARSDVSRIVTESQQPADTDQAADDQPQSETRQTRAEIMAARGMFWYEGRFQSKQHIELLEAAKKVRVNEADWNNRLKRWRKWLGGRRQERIDEAVREIQAIRDPLAVPAIVEMLSDEQNPAVKRLLVDVAAEIAHPQTTDALITLSLFDPDEELRYQCLEYLMRTGRPGIAAPYIRALSNPNNVIINRAAASLETIGDRDAVGPLINSLVTIHKHQVGSGSANQQAHSFSQSGGTSMSYGGGGKKTVTRAVENRAVLTALVALSDGVNFGYDEGRWRDWLAAQVKANPIDVRRDQ